MLKKKYLNCLKNNINCSFFMLKPGTVDNPEILDSIINEMNLRGVKKILEYRCLLKEKQVIGMWRNTCCRDYVLQRIVVEYLKNKEVTFWFVEGHDIYKTTKEIKKKIRELYAKNWLENILHTPENYEEFLECVVSLNTLPKIYFERSRFEEDYINYLLDNENFLGSVIKSYIEEGISWIYSRVESPQYRYMLTIDSRCIKSVTYFMADLHDIFPHYSIEKCFFLTEAIFEMDSYPVFQSNSISDVNNKKNDIERRGYKALINEFG